MQCYFGKNHRKSMEFSPQKPIPQTDTFLQGMIIYHNIFILSPVHPEAPRDHAHLHKAQFFIQPAGRGVGGYNGVELQQTESVLFCGSKAVPDEGFPNALSSGIPCHGITGIGDMSAPADVVAIRLYRYKSLPTTASSATPQAVCSAKKASASVGERVSVWGKAMPSATIWFQISVMAGISAGVYGRVSIDMMYGSFVMG